MNMTECSIIRDAAVECIERLYEFSAEECKCSKAKDSNKKERLQKEITAEMYGVLANISMDIANEPWREDLDVRSLEERLFILKSISQLMEELS